jgi:hypothetical protein
MHIYALTYTHIGVLEVKLSIRRILAPQAMPDNLGARHESSLRLLGKWNCWRDPRRAEGQSFKVSGKQQQRDDNIHPCLGHHTCVAPQWAAPLDFSRSNVQHQGAKEDERVEWEV